MTSTTDLPDPLILDAFATRGAPRAAARRLAHAYPGARGLAAASPAEIAHAGTLPGRHGSAPAWAARIASAAALGRMMNASRLHRETIGTPSRAREVLTRYVAHERSECFAVAMLDARMGLIEATIVHRGTLAAVDVHPREVFRPAIRCGAQSIVIAHNHPSGNATPSEADVDLTARLVETGRTVGIPVVDHLVIAPGGCVSMAERGMMGGT